MPGNADMATQPAGAKGARPPSQGPRLDALAIAQLTGGVRLVSADAETQIARFADPSLLHSGKVNLISLEAVQHRLGDRWLQKREQVFAFAEKVLERAIGAGGVYLRISDTDFFIIQPDLGRFAGQAACLRQLREILIHFLGDADPAATGVLQVTKISRGRLEAQPIDIAAAEASLPRGEIDQGEEATRLAAFDLERAPAGPPEPLDAVHCRGRAPAAHLRHP